MTRTHDQVMASLPADRQRKVRARTRELIGQEKARSMLRYVELKSGFGDKGPAWIGRVKISRSKTTVYFNGRALRKAIGGGVSGNYLDIETREEFWVSGIKKNGEDRHWAGSGRVLVEAAAVQEYLALRNLDTLDRSRYAITDSILPTDIAKFKEIENPGGSAVESDTEEARPLSRVGVREHNKQMRAIELSLLEFMRRAA